MKLSRLFNSWYKKLASLFILAMAVAVPVSSVAADQVRLEGALGVANISRGDKQFTKETNASYDQVVQLRVFYHNLENENSGKNANNLTVKINIPTSAGKSQTVTSKISADNANTINSNVKVNLDSDKSYLEYIPGTAVWRHNVGTNAKVNFVDTKLSDDIVYGGQGLRLENAKPCYNFAASVTVQARVRTPGIKVNKYVRVKGQTQWTTSNTAKPGDTLQYQIAYKNGGNTLHKSVVIRDNLPPKMQYVAGTTQMKNQGGIKSVPDGVTRGGVIVGNYGPGADAYVMFEVKVPNADQLACGVTEFRNVGVARPQGMNEFYNTAITKVTRDCHDVKQPYCIDLTVKKLGNRKVEVGVKYQANGANFKFVNYDFGDNTTLQTDKTSGVVHTYKDNDEHTISAKLHFDVDGKNVVVGGNECTAVVSKTTTPETPETPETPGELTKTGAGSIAGIFTGTSVASALLHRKWQNRKLR